MVLWHLGMAHKNILTTHTVWVVSMFLEVLTTPKLCQLEGFVWNLLDVKSDLQRSSLKNIHKSEKLMSYKCIQNDTSFLIRRVLLK